MPVQPRESVSDCSSAAYSPRPVVGFSPKRIVLAKGSNGSTSGSRLVDATCAAYPQAVVEAFEPNTPSSEERLLTLEARAEAGYPVRAVVMPILPLPEWITIYGEFLVGLLRRVRLSRLTLGSICSYPQALRLSKQKLGDDNLISTQLARRRQGAADGRLRFPRDARRRIYRHLLSIIRGVDAELEVGLCLEEPEMLEWLGMNGSLGRCAAFGSQ